MCPDREVKYIDTWVFRAVVITRNEYMLYLRLSTPLWYRPFPGLSRCHVQVCTALSTVMLTGQETRRVSRAAILPPGVVATAMVARLSLVGVEEAYDIRDVGTVIGSNGRFGSTPLRPPF
jgi:hypothetical protein